MRSTLKTESVGCVSTAMIGRLCSPLVVLTQVKKSKVTVHSMIKLSLHDVLDSLVGRNEHAKKQKKSPSRFGRTPPRRAFGIILAIFAQDYPGISCLSAALGAWGGALVAWGGQWATAEAP